MANRTHLNELLAQETSTAAQMLLDAFTTMVRDPGRDAHEFSAGLRQVMDALLKELVNASAKPDRP